MASLCAVTEGSRKAVLAAMVANAGIAIAKFVGFLITRSAGMLAESVHSVADTSNQALLLLGGKRAEREADSQHPFGYGRERYFWSFVVALILFSMGGLFALYEGIQKVRDPHEIESLAVAVGILLFAIALESYSLRTAYKEAKHAKPADVGWISWLRNAKSPELPVVLLEDIGAEFGLFFALCGVLLAEATDNARWDAVGSITIGVLLICIAIVLAIEMKSLLIGEAASAENIGKIEQSFVATDGVTRVIHMRTQHIGPDELLVAAKLEFDASMAVERVAATIDEAEANLRAAVPIARVVYIEPDIKRVAAQ